jgi:hypothetical protein
MAILSFGAMCHYSDVDRSKWRNVYFDIELKYFEINFERRKNSRFRQDNKVTVATSKIFFGLSFEAIT